MLSWTERYRQAGTDIVAFKNKGMGEHRECGIFNAEMMWFSFSGRQNFHNMELRAKECQSLIWSLILNQCMPSGE